MTVAKVVHLCASHSADDGRVFHRACSTLAAAGYEVHLFARVDDSPEGEPIERNGVLIHPVAAAPNRLVRFSRAKALAEQAAALRPDLVHVHEPELLGPAIAHCGAPVVWDVHESYLDVLSHRHWIPVRLRPVVRMLWDRRERQLLKGCAAVITSTPSVAARYTALGHHPVVVANFPELEVSSWTTPQPAGSIPRCIFTGGLNRNRGLLETIDAMALLRDRGVPCGFDMIGPATDVAFEHEIDSRIATLGLQELVTRRGYLPRAEAIALQQHASFGVVPHLPYGNNLQAWPVKLLEFLAAGLPVVWSDLPSHRELLEGFDVGPSVDPTRPAEIADAIQGLIRDPARAAQLGENGRRAVRERLSWAVERPKLLEVYAGVLATSKSGHA